MYTKPNERGADLAMVYDLDTGLNTPTDLSTSRPLSLEDLVKWRFKHISFRPVHGQMTSTYIVVACSCWNAKFQNGH